MAGKKKKKAFGEKSEFSLLERMGFSSDEDKKKAMERKRKKIAKMD